MQLSLNSDLLTEQKVPEGKSRLVISDKVCRGLSLEIRKPGGSSWRMRYSFQKEQRCITLGKGHQLSLDQARKIAIKIRELLKNNQDPSYSLQKILPQSGLTFGDFIDKHYYPYIATYKKCPSADKTLLTNHLLPAFGKIQMTQIRRIMVMEFMQTKVNAGYKPGYCNRFLVLLNYCFSLAQKWDLIDLNENPIKGISLLKNLSRPERFLQKNELNELINAVSQSSNPLLKYFVPFALLTGARKREILDAKWAQINFMNQTWFIPMTKSGKALTIPLTSQTMELLEALKRELSNLFPEKTEDSMEWLFPNPKTGKPFKSIFNAWHTARIKAGLSDLRIHDLRHSFASALVNSGIPIYDVQKLLGHQSVKTTERYSHLSQDRLRESSSNASKFYNSLILK